MEAYADALAGFLDARGLRQVVVVGGSMGGVVAQHLVLRHPDRVLRVLLVATGAVTADAPGALAKADALAAAAWDENTVRPIVDGFFHRPPPAAELARYRNIALQASQHAAVGAARSNANSRTLERLDGIRVPTGIVQGKYDRVQTPEHGLEMQERIPSCWIEVIEDSGHTPHLEQPARFHNLTLPFLLTSQ